MMFATNCNAWSLVLLAACSGAVASCSGGLNKSDIANAINARLTKGSGQSCWSVNNPGQVTWPVRVNRTMNMLSPGPMDPILYSMAFQNYITVDNQVQGVGQMFALPSSIDTITPTAQAKTWWDNRNGWCVGKMTVDDVQKWTDPGKEEGTPITANFTWKLTDVPQWATPSVFKRVPGMEPVAGVAHLRHTSQGWEVTDLSMSTNRS